MMDVVYVHKQKNSGEIEASLKSLKNVEHGKVYIIGDDPKLDDIEYIHVPHKQHRWVGTSKYADQISKYLQACEMPEVSESFIAMNDDFFIMKQWCPVNYNQGLLENHIKRRRHDAYGRSLRETEKYLKLRGLSTLDFELHTPFVFEKTKLKELVNSLTKYTLQIRSLYGNTYTVDTVFMRDVKNPSDYSKVLISTSANTFKSRLGNYIRRHI